MNEDYGFCLPEAFRDDGTKQAFVELFVQQILSLALVVNRCSVREGIK